MGRSVTSSLAPDTPQGPGDSPWCGVALPDSTTCFHCQHRAAGTRGSGRLSTAAAAAAAAVPSSLMASAEQTRSSRSSGSARQPAPLLQAFTGTPAISAGRELHVRMMRGRGEKKREGEASGSQSRAAPSAARMPSAD